VKNGKLRAIGHSLARRSALLADLPPVAETVPGYDFTSWYGFFAPRGTPKAIIDRVHAAMARSLALAEVREQLAAQGAEIFAGSAEDFRKFLAQEIAATQRVIKAAQLQPE